MMTTGEILAGLQKKLDAGDILKKEIAAAMGVGQNRVSELFGSGNGRGLRHDEAVKLVRVFGLEQDRPARPLPLEICRLLVRYVAAGVGVPLEDDDPRLEELSATYRAFSRFVADPEVRGSIDAAIGFFRTIQALQTDDA